MTVEAPAAPVDVRTTALGGPPLARALLAGDPRVSAWYADRPRGRAEWLRRAQATRAPFGSRGEWLDALWPAIAAQGDAAARLRRAAAGGVLITTGQQPGLFGGPIYTWSKALGALALADALEAALGLPVAPLFWAATDDSDQREARSTWIAVPGGATHLTAPGSAPEGTILGAVPLGDVSDALARLTAATGSASFADALTATADAYRPDATVGGAYLDLLRHLLGPFGIPVLDASHDAVRRAAFPLLRSALARAADVETAVAARTTAIAGAGFDPQVDDVAALSLVFTYQGAIKQRVPIARAAAVAASATPGGLSPNVLLRPIVEAAILPTIAYVAGPGELAYFAQVGAAAAALGLGPPLAVPRWSTTIVESHVARLMARRGLTPDDLRDPHHAEQRLARSAMPADVREALDAVRRSLDLGLAQVERASRGLDVPSPAFSGALRSMGFKLDRLERRLRVAVKRAERDAMAELGTLRGALYPGGSPQERALNFIPLLARNGPPLLDAMRHAAARHAATLIG